MGEYAFYELKERIPLPRGAELLPLPVRSEMEGRVFGGPEVQLGLLPDELAVFLAEYPEFKDRYAGTEATIAWLVGVSAGLDGDDASAERHFTEGLAARPDDLILRANYALILHIQGRNEEALRQYEMVLTPPERPTNPMVDLLAARLYAEMGRFQDAYDLLAPLEGEFFTDDSYGKLLVDLKKRAAAPPSPSAAPVVSPSFGPPAPPPAAPAAGVDSTPTQTVAYCACCGAPVERGQRFCGKCGRAVELSPAPVLLGAPSVASGTSYPVRHTFCGKCGNRLVEGQLPCPRCGWMARET